LLGLDDAIMERYYNLAGAGLLYARLRGLPSLLEINAPLYARLGVHFDTILGESFFNDKMAPVVAAALAAGVATRADDGAVVVELPDLPTFLLERRDGGTLYHTRDAATIAYRESTYAPAAIVYVVDARQELHFRQLFALMRARVRRADNIRPRQFRRGGRAGWAAARGAQGEHGLPPGAAR
jgi:arginyl-tRNA synthetase